MRSYIKIIGPPMREALRALEKLAVETPEVCIMDSFIEADYAKMANIQAVREYFAPYKMTQDRCNHIISKSGGSVGDFDFYFEWFVKPSMDQLGELIGKIDETLKPIGVQYMITTKN